MTDRRGLLLERAEEFARVTLTNVCREYPRWFQMTLPGPVPLPSRPRQLNPAFYSCYDWHSADAITTEAAHIVEYGGSARPYGWGWALTLTNELAGWDDPDARRWAVHMRPLAELFTTRFLAWLPKATYPIRQGAHYNSAFGLQRALGYARSLADTTLLDTITATARRWFGSDTGYPGECRPGAGAAVHPRGRV
jgi:hypothetical protein